MIEVVFIQDGMGKLLISRNYRKGKIKPKLLSERFRNNVMNDGDNEKLESPVFVIGRYSYLFIKQPNLYFVVVTQKNINSLIAFQFLFKFVELLRKFFGGEMNEEIITENIISVHKFLDEVIDFGIPQTFNFESISSLYPEIEPHENIEEMYRPISICVTGCINWRKRGIRYRTNDIFVDVQETVNILMNSRGDVLSNEVIGKINLKAYLSGMPECKMILNDSILFKVHRIGPRQLLYKSSNFAKFDEVKFHRCVRYPKCNETFQPNLCFVPLDGEFELLSYNIRRVGSVVPPFRMLSSYTRIGETRYLLTVSITSNYSHDNIGKYVVVRIPVPSTYVFEEKNLRITNGIMEYVPEENLLVWKFKKFLGGGVVEKVYGDIILLRPTNKVKKWTIPPIRVSFSISKDFSASRMRVRCLRVYEAQLNYKTNKWIRYVTKSGSYEQNIHQ